MLVTIAFLSILILAYVIDMYVEFLRSLRLFLHAIKDLKTITKLRQPIKLRVIQRIWSVFKADFNQNSKISAQELKEVGRGRVDWSQLGTS